ncbi:hypothetical protein GCM10022398_21400 [Acetobacter lovaniensis]|jgi:hypothetical protein|uniref:Uncharacterized protein n=2 Tax=Acetobacter TaxID=434 RepID=A0A841QHV6_9PROT|nr:hypothetical protein [Acetobacter lambici]MBB6458699.1 hypothetical protein [Acetobacter lovaniensis]MCP1244151.1 hypothetical protein [Acetobacter lambici]MCP1259732.1 hypothetical protein [Acetobacter lambici]GBQ66516.1 hypothetical protein AA0474_1142 [Acetobacter lovaniensis NRIC 0474]
MDNFIDRAKSIATLVGVTILFVILVVFPIIDLLDPKAHLVADIAPLASVLSSLI